MKHFLKQIDWNVVQVIILVGLVPAMILIGALFFPLFTPNYGK
jgi:hypothetical protein